MLLIDFKEEGNILFKDEKSYYKAAEHYTAALNLGKLLQIRDPQDGDNKCMSSLFTNRAACCSKMVSDAFVLCM